VQYAFDYLKILVNTKSLAGKEVYHYSIPNVQEFNDSILEEGDEIDSDKLLVEGGEVLISKLNPRKNTVILTKKKEKDSVCSSEFIPLKPILYDEKHAFYLLSCSKIADFLNSAVESATKSHQRVKPDTLLKQVLPIPPLSEQTTIVTYLDRKTAQIDQSIAEKEGLIELFREERQAIINHAVTKGIRPGVKMKPSGVEWIGDVPEGWEVSKLKYQTSKITDGTHLTPVYEDEGIPFLRVTDIHLSHVNLSEVKRISVKEHSELIKRCNPEKGDVLLSKNGTIGITKVVDWDWEFSIFVSLCLIKFKENLMNKFFSYFFESNVVDQQISEGSKKTSVTNLHLDKIRELLICVPPKTEQISIVAYLDQKTAQIDTAISGIRQEITLLQEYRQALIFEAVTGKIDARENTQN